MNLEKKKSVAENVKKTEVKLTLPDQKTKAGKNFSIEGVVDIIQEDEILAMYDIKTHDIDYIKMNKALYADQLNLYGHIYESLNQEKLDKTAIISTSFPPELLKRDEPDWDKKFNEWNPVVDSPYNRKDIKKTVEAFSDVVHKIENREFQPATLKTLTEKPAEKGIPTFAIRVCRNCDVRYTCSSYLAYAEEKRERSMNKGFFQIYFGDEDRDRLLDLISFDTPDDLDELDLDDLE